MAPAQSRLASVGLFVLGAAAPAILMWLLRSLRRQNPATISASDDHAGKPKSQRKKVLILHGSTTGTASAMAATLATELERSRALEVKVVGANSYNDENFDKEDVVLFICSTWTDGVAPESARIFMSWLNDTATDFRVSKSMLAKVSFAAFGLGGKVYSDNFCKPVKEFSECMTTLGATSLLPVECGDDASDLEQKFEAWKAAVVSILVDPDDTIEGAAKKLKLKAYRKQNREEEDAGAEDEVEEEDRINDMYVCASDTEDEDIFGPQGSKAIEVGDDDDHGAVVDVEDMGPVMKRSDEERKTTAVAREMVTKLQRKALTKEGYKIIGSHSAVKLCRWTKNQMRGRGGCYKHTCYGITSYQCMEATPSLACANKCVFCWRHHKNPVGTEWRWKTDEPMMIVEQAISEHRKMINQMRGVSGVQPERLKEAMTVKHCALSLVGEPIMYPHINEMLQELHNRSISTFLVTNGQFPECIDTLDPVTQLYVSVDAPTRDSLKAVDRPLFKDFWERYIASLKALGRKQQRTVYRLTLVKDYNMQDLDGYVELIEIGQPDFIEIKAMTYCGKSDASSLTMQNVPWHKEVCEYAELISRRLAERGISAPLSIASEHEHSCLVLMAREDKFKVDGVWHTWIDYPKFDALIQEYYASGKTATFTSTDYMLRTPDWALYQSSERGFDPKEQRWRRNASGATVENSYKPSASGCG